MREESSSWEKVYREVKFLWGSEPDPMLIKYANLVPEGKVLDVGMGEGRNALPFAKMGYEVEGIDISVTCIERCIKRALETKLKVEAQVEDLRKLAIPPERYSLIIAAWVLNFFKKKEAEEIILKMKNGLKEKGLVYIAAFGLNDAGYERAKRSLELIENNTFYSSKEDCYYHYFTKDEIISPFAKLKTIYYARGTSLDLGHAKPHYHGFIEYLGQKS